METVQQNGRFTLFPSKFLYIYSILYGCKHYKFEFFFKILFLRATPGPSQFLLIQYLDLDERFLIIKTDIIRNKYDSRKIQYLSSTLPIPITMSRVLLCIMPHLEFTTIFPLYCFRLPGLSRILKLSLQSMITWSQIMIVLMWHTMTR